MFAAQYAEQYHHSHHHHHAHYAGDFTGLSSDAYDHSAALTSHPTSSAGSATGEHHQKQQVHHRGSYNGSPAPGVMADPSTDPFGPMSGYAFASAQAYHNEYHHAQQQQQQQHATCFVCRVQHVPQTNSVCSRRCGWVANGCCPQCGRERYNTPTVFCGHTCANEARQANWCVGCGVRQQPHGMSYCGAPACATAVERIFSRFGPSPQAHFQGRPQQQQQQQPQFRPRNNSLNSSGGSSAAAGSGAAPRGRRRFEPHVSLPHADKVAASVRQQLGADLARRVVAIVKVGGPADARKAYTAYRCRVEAEMNELCGIGAPKFGHGGEGNEHRRYTPLRTDCGERLISGTTETARVCSSINCQVCRLLDAGVPASFAESATVAAFSTAASAAHQASVSPSGKSALSALLVSRVTVGHPKVIEQDDAKGLVAPPPEADGSSSSAATSTTHSTVLQRDGFDEVHVHTALPAVDPLYVVLLRAPSE